MSVQSTSISPQEFSTLICKHSKAQGTLCRDPHLLEPAASEGSPSLPSPSVMQFWGCCPHPFLVAYLGSKSPSKFKNHFLDTFQFSYKSYFLSLDQLSVVGRTGGLSQWGKDLHRLLAAICLVVLYRMSQQDLQEFSAPLDYKGQGLGDRVNSNGKRSICSPNAECV